MPSGIERPRRPGESRGTFHIESRSGVDELISYSSVGGEASLILLPTLRAEDIRHFPYVPFEFIAREIYSDCVAPQIPSMDFLR